MRCVVIIDFGLLLGTSTSIHSLGEQST